MKSVHKQRRKINLGINYQTQKSAYELSLEFQTSEKNMEYSQGKTNFSLTCQNIIDVRSGSENGSLGTEIR